MYLNGNTYYYTHYHTYISMKIWLMIFIILLQEENNYKQNY